MLEGSDVEMSDGAISTRGGEGIRIFSEPDIEDLLVMSNQLRLDLLLLDVPDRARGVNGTRAQGGGVSLIPVEGSQWSLALGVLNVNKLTSLRTAFKLAFCPL